MKLSDSEEKTRLLIQPMLDLFSGADGGVGFVKMRTFIEMIMAKKDPSDLELQFVDNVTKMSNFCKMLMK